MEILTENDSCLSSSSEEENEILEEDEQKKGNDNKFEILDEQKNEKIEALQRIY